MRTGLSIKLLFRSPLKTLLTFVLLGAAAFLLTYNMLDYTMTQREHARAVDSYRGVFSVEGERPEQPELDPAGLEYPIFLLSEDGSPVTFDAAYSYENYHQAAMDDIDEILSMNCVTGAQTRAMGAGVSDKYRRIDEEDYYSYANRGLLEATVVRLEKEPEKPYDRNWEAARTNWKEEKGIKNAYDLYITDIEMLAGDPEWMQISDTEAPEGQSRVRFWATDEVYNARRGEFFFPFEVWFGKSFKGQSENRYMSCYWDNSISVTEAESLIPGERYVFAVRAEPLAETASSFYHFTMGDDSLYDWWPYFYKAGDGDYLDSEEAGPLRELMEITDKDLHTFDVVYSGDMSGIRRVAKGDILCVDGRLLTDRDTAEKNAVCVVSSLFLEQNGLSMGDTLTLSLGDRLFEQYAPAGAVACFKDRYAKNWTEQTFEIVGAFTDTYSGKLNDNEFFWAYSENTIFVPSCFLPDTAESIGYRPGEISFIVGDPYNLEAFQTEVMPLLEEKGYKVYFSDGGWSAVENQLEQAGSLSTGRLAAFVAASVLASALVVYLFIVRKKREYAIMRALGTKKSRSAATLLIPLMVTAVVASVLGGVASAIYAADRAEKSLKPFIQLGLEVDASIPAGIVILAIAGLLIFILAASALMLARIGSIPPLLLLQEKTNRGKERK